jgi:glycosyltransferase involved in cell wall biosynthesis
VEINTTYEVAVLIPELNPASIAEAIHSLLTDTALYERLRQNCLLAKEVFNWQHEEKKLVGFYRNLLQQY